MTPIVGMLFVVLREIPISLAIIRYVDKISLRGEMIYLNQAEKLLQPTKKRKTVAIKISKSISIFDVPKKTCVVRQCTRNVTRKNYNYQNMYKYLM